MTWSQEISQLITDVDQLTSAANVKKSVLDASVASTEADKNAAVASAAAATVSAATSLTRAQESEAHKNTALAVYGTTAAQQTAVASVQVSAALASGYAANASAALQQDLSGIATALHRSPNAITSMFIYDTSKDSDGGAWTEKCQKTSWYNEPIMGKWLGPHINETYARYSNATLGAELIANGNFSNGSTGWTLSAMTLVDGMVTGSGSGGVVITQSAPITAGKLYRVEYTVRVTTALVTVYARLNSADINYGTNISPSATFNTIVQYVVAGSGTTGFQLTAGNVGVGNTIYIDNVSFREVTALNTTSGDYFQSTTDGKFYRLWKNLLSRSDDFRNTATAGEPRPWIISVANVTADVSVAPDGTTTADQLAVSNSTANYSLTFSSIAAVSSNTYTLSVYVKAGTLSEVSLYLAGATSLRAIFNIATQTVSGVGTSISATSITAVGNNGWYRCSLTGVYAYPGGNGPGFGQAGTTNGDILIWGAQLELGTVATVYEPKTTIGSISEVFRGNKRDFPRLAGIVAEGANINIYDLTEPGRPMWMRLTNGVNTFLGWATPTTVTSSIAAAASRIVIGTGSHGQILDFANDDCSIAYGGGTSFYEHINRRISSRQANGGFRTTPTTAATGIGYIIANGTVNSVAMTVMPDAPTDPATGLRVPTIALATGGGVSIIKQDGTVVSGDGQGTNNITITPNIMTWFNTAYTSSRYLLNPGKIAVFPALGEYNQSTTEFGANNNTQRDFMPKRNLRLRSLTSSGPVRLLNQNDTNIMRGLTGKIGGNFNTGWLPGDIRRVYLSDNLPGSAAANIQVEDFSTYANDAAMKLVWNQGTAANGSLVGGKLRLVAAGGTALGRSWPTIPGKTYSISVTVATGTVAAIRLGSSNYSVSYGQFSDRPVGTWRTTFTATGTLFFAGTYGNAAGISEISNFTLTEIEIDRSYKAQVANITGTLTKSQLASGTSLVGYSGWSVDNYLREPYSADLDFGIGEWSASAWVNYVTGNPDVNLLSFSDILTNTTTWGNISGSIVTITNAASDGITSAYRYIKPNGVSFACLTLRQGVTGTLAWTVEAKIDGASPITSFHMSMSPAGGDSNYANFNLSTGTAAAFGSVTSAFIEPLSDGWYRCTGVATGAWVFNDGDLRIFPGGRSYVGDGVSGILFARSRARSATTAPTSHISTTGTVFNPLPGRHIFSRSHSTGPSINCGFDGYGRISAVLFDGTTTRTVTTTTTYNSAQWLKADVNYTTDGSLAIRVNGREVAVTRGNPLANLTTGKNLLSFSESFDNSAWAKFIMGVTANVAIAPDGTTTADLMYPTANNTNNSLYRGGFPTVQKTHSVYAKAAGKNWLVILQESTIGGAAWFNLASGSVGTTSAGYTGATITPIGIDGWYRCSVTSTSGFNQYTAFGAVDADNTTTVVASGINGIYLWGAQIEATSSVTSYAATNVAPLTIGNNFALNAPFVGSIALLKLSTTVPTTEQSTFMYEQEKQLFRANAVSVLPDTNVILDMSYDDVTDCWVAISTTNESYWNGLVRSSVTPVPTGSYSRITTTSGIELAARITTNPGVDVTIPPYVLREELVKRSETANKLNRQTAIYDYIGGFTGNITTGSTAIASVTNLTYPVSPVGARISGTGIPANTTIVAVVGTTMYISAAATATTTGLVISFLDFNLPVGFETESVTSAGVVKQEGTTKDYARLFDGFVEMIRFAVAPGATTWVRIQASKSS